MRAEQAIYTSARTNRASGYHLIAQSSGIDEHQARALIQWCPSHAGLASEETGASSLNFHPLDDGWVALSRTVYGGPEYSARGGLQIVTRVLLLRSEYLAGYQYDPVMVAQVAMAFGHLRLEPSAPEVLPTLDLPDRPNRAEPVGDPVTDSLVNRIWNCVTSGKRALVVGAQAPLLVLALLLASLPERQRLDLAFTTGLKPSMNRPFRLHFLPAADAGLQQQLARQGICIVT
jgi:hypothetical protein